MCSSWFISLLIMLCNYDWESLFDSVSTSMMFTHGGRVPAYMGIFLIHLDSMW